jgi:hypothetical protein
MGDRLSAFRCSAFDVLADVLRDVSGIAAAYI